MVYSCAMRSWPWHQAGTVIAACGWVLGITAVLGLLRLLPWLLRPEVPWAVAAPFAAAIGAKATETTMLLGLPIGCGLAAARLGGDRAASSTRLLMFPTATALLLMLVGANWNANASEPGRVAIALLEQTRKSCQGATEPRGAVVPMVGMSWLCFPGREPRVVGMLPGSGGKAWFSALSLDAQPDLSGFELRDFQLVGDAEPVFSAANLRVKRARVTGLPPWGRPAKLPVKMRSAILALAAWLIASVVTMSHARLSLQRPLPAVLAAATPALAVVALLDRLDSSAEALSYAWLPVLAAFGAALGTLAAWAVSRRLGARGFAGEWGE